MDDRPWMYRRVNEGYVTQEFYDGVGRFVNFAFSKALPEIVIRCPCVKCDNRKFQNKDVVIEHLLRKGFTPFYSRWIYHGEMDVEETLMSESLNSNMNGCRRNVNPQHWLESSGGLAKGKMYGAPHIDISSLHRDSQSSTDSHQRYTPQPPSTQPLHTPFSLEQVGQWVLEKLRQSSNIPTRSTIPMQTTIPTHVTSSQPTVPMSPPISAQPTMFTQAGMPTQSPQMGFSPLPATFPHTLGNMSMPMGAYPSQQSPFPSNTFGTAQQNMSFFDLLQQQYPYMQQFSHVHQASQSSMSYQRPCNFEEGRHDEGAQ